MYNEQFSADQWHKEASSVAQRNAVQPRRWGMRVTVYTGAGAGEYVLTYGNASTSKNDNANWLKVADIGQTWGGGGGSATLAKSQTFAYTGVESQFTVNNGTLDQINFVEVNGNVQIPTTNYTVAGQVVDFGSALPGTGTVVVYYYEDLSIGAIPTLSEVLTQGNAAGGLKITGLANPTLAQDAATKIYADALPKVIQAACSDETTPLTVGTGKVTFRIPQAMTLTAVRASLTTAQASGSIFTVDINKNGVSILSTKLTIDNTEKTSTTAANPPVISDSSMTDDAEITVDIDQVGNGTATGLKITLIGS